MTGTELCRKNGWTVGTRLVGDEGYGPEVIEITAIGEEGILAKNITRKQPEKYWTLLFRKWKKLEAV